MKAWMSLLLVAALTGGLLGYWSHFHADPSPSLVPDAVAEVPVQPPRSQSAVTKLTPLASGNSRDAAVEPEPHAVVDASDEQVASTTEPPAPQDASALDWLKRVRPEVYAALENGDLSALKDLDLRGADITDADLYWIGQLTQLTSLSLYGTPVTDAGLAYLAGLANLERINLRGTQVTAMGLRYLPTISLEHLHLCNSRVALDDLASTPPMPSIVTLKINFMQFRDKDVASLIVYPNLNHLEIDRSNLTDTGLARLMEDHPNLARLEIRNTAVTHEGVQAMRALYPHCEFVTE